MPNCYGTELIPRSAAVVKLPSEYFGLGNGKVRNKERKREVNITLT